VKRLDPTERPEWRAIALECKLTRQLLGAGLTALGKANYADGMGQYYSAFFSLSVGLERLCKLILSFEYEQEHGQFPKSKELRNFGHKIIVLINKATEVVSMKNLVLNYDGYDNRISAAIISELDAFADAKRGRYANFEMMEGSNHTDKEPLSSWVKNVGEPILQKHFRGTQREEAAKFRSKLMETLLGEVSTVNHRSEDGTKLNTIEKSSFRSVENEVFQKYGRYYSFLIIRHLSEIFSNLTSLRGYEAGGELWFGHYEHFNTFIVPNKFGLSRKIWPLH
jgi:hypothetical protein